MNNFNPGDKVTFVNEKLNAIVKAQMPSRKVLVILEDGFEIPVSEHEIILVERASSTEGSMEHFSKPVLDTDDKIYLAFVKENDAKNTIKVWLINNTAYPLLFTVYRLKNLKYAGVAKAEISEAAATLVSSFELMQADEWKNWFVQILKFQDKKESLQAPIQKEIKLRPSKLMNEGELIPLLDQYGIKYLLQNAIEEKIVLEKDPVQSKEPKILHDEILEVIDLHAEAILEPGIEISNQSILNLQLEYFMNMLEKAVAKQMSKITFIHGIGAGVLKKAIRKRLDQHTHVERFEDGDTKNFGYGATTVYIKNR